MGSSASETGKAYQTMTGSINRARVDMTNDPSVATDRRRYYPGADRS